MSIKRNKKRNSVNTLYDSYTSTEELFEFKEGYKLTKGIVDVSNEEVVDDRNVHPTNTADNASLGHLSC